MLLSILYYTVFISFEISAIKTEKTLFIKDGKEDPLNKCTDIPEIKVEKLEEHVKSSSIRISKRLSIKKKSPKREYVFRATKPKISEITLHNSCNSYDLIKNVKKLNNEKKRCGRK